MNQTHSGSSVWAAALTVFAVYATSLVWRAERLGTYPWPGTIISDGYYSHSLIIYCPSIIYGCIVVCYEFRSVHGSRPNDYIFQLVNELHNLTNSTLCLTGTSGGWGTLCLIYSSPLEWCWDFFPFAFCLTQTFQQNKSHISWGL